MARKEKYNPKDFLKPDVMLNLYAQGAFPMVEDDNEINWYMPQIRTVILPEEFNIPRSLKKFISTSSFEFKYDFDSLKVIRNCADREKTWISEELISAYRNLIDLGFLHSVETYQDGKLVGGLYGIAFRGAFFGESMFSGVSQASKCALVKLVERLRERNFVILDVQYQTEHLKMFGAKEISFADFSQLLQKAYKNNVKF